MRVVVGLAITDLTASARGLGGGGLTLLQDQWAWLAAMVILILLSAFFSGSEAALFSLREKERRRVRLAGSSGRRADAMLENPDRLLSAILFWNLLINMTYFAIAAILGERLEASRSSGSAMAILFTIGSLMAIIFFSEMLPKSVAVLSPARVSLLVSLPLSLSVRLVSPLLPVVRGANFVARRLIWPTFQPEPELDLADIERAIELSTDDAALLQREQQVMRRLVGMSDTRADELMRPRGRLTMVTRSEGELAVPDGSLPGGYLYVADDSDDSIIAAVHVRMLRPSQWEDLKAVAEPVIYVPWTAKVAQVFDQLLAEDRRVAVVVNEFGESIGAMTVEDILRSILAPAEGNDEGEASIVPLDDGRLRLSGSVSLRVLTKHLQIDEPEERTATVAGFIQRNNERLPRPGDTAVLDEYLLTVVAEDDDQITIEVSPVIEVPPGGEATP